MISNSLNHAQMKADLEMKTPIWYVKLDHLRWRSKAPECKAAFLIFKVQLGQTPSRLKTSTSILVCKLWYFTEWQSFQGKAVTLEHALFHAVVLGSTKTRLQSVKTQLLHACHATCTNAVGWWGLWQESPWRPKNRTGSWGRWACQWKCAKVLIHCLLILQELEWLNKLYQILNDSETAKISITFSYILHHPMS